MRKVFWDDPYQTSLTTKVKAINGNQVLLDETIAYSFSGGQESDKAYINKLLITGSTMDKDLIYYSLPDNHGLTVGDEVCMTIDWDRRLKLMRLHFAAELVLEIVTQEYHLEKIGAHIAETKARIDFRWDQNIKTIFDFILNKYNQIIKANVPIYTGYTDIANQRRFWKIDGFAQVPCGGTHVRSTAEVGYIELKREHPGKAIERIEIRLIDGE